MLGFKLNHVSKRDHWSTHQLNSSVKLIRVCHQNTGRRKNSPLVTMPVYNPKQIFNLRGKIDYFQGTYSCMYIETVRQLNALSFECPNIGCQIQECFSHSFVASNYNYSPRVRHHSCSITNNSKLKKTQERSLHTIWWLKIRCLWFV